ncbi:putative G-protein coupled receptor [Pseudolycoriella hygida]|uniref:G-protein coupled receptor n=1 Tax=Pseudolycoriella hygida TaxID=35572 RepID=A0A9Q0MXL6_9DIPT|nr:putative G-protein coupled receptor [Pseudolycoriella hygida]
MPRLYPSQTSISFCSITLSENNVTSGHISNGINEDPRTEALRKLSYGLIIPTICALGIIGNVLNLVVLTRRNMRGTAYIYMRGYSAAALLAIVFALPFAIGMIGHKDAGEWRHFGQAFYSAHLELFLGNACIGIGVMMLLVLTVERYVSVCHPGIARPVMGPPRLTVALIPLITFLVYLPSVFRGEILKCVLHSDGTFVYQKKDNEAFLKSIFYSIYKVALEIFFKLVPTVLIAGLNLRIIIVYRRSCAKRRQMTIARNILKDDDPRKFAEERRLILLLGSTSILFLVCVSPMAILHVTLSHENLNSYSYQVFRALANLMELTNYSITFYIYCLFSEDFRNTLFRTLKWPWIGNPICNQRKDDFQLQSRPIIKTKKIANKSNHIHHTTTSGLCTLGRSSSI